MYPMFFSSAITNIELTKDEFNRFHKIIHFNLYLLKYITILLYQDVKSYCNPKNLDELVIKNFRSPTEGQWLSLFEKLLHENKHIFKQYDKELKKKFNSEITTLFNSAFSIFINKELVHDNNIDIFNYFRKIISMKNNFISHGMVQNEQAYLINQALYPATKKVFKIVMRIFDVPIVSIHENYVGEKIITNYYNPKDIDVEDKEGFDDSGLYCILGDKIASLDSFIISRDGNIYFYGKSDMRHKRTYYNAFEKEIYRKESVDDLPSIFGIDSFALNIKPLNFVISHSKNGIFHNLPQLEGESFVGRKEELTKLQNMIEHQRLFITALDGIGGVGKTTIVREYCRLLTDDKNYHNMEFIIWVSAKTTKLYKNKIHELKQAFEHVEQLIDSILDVTGFSDSEYKNNNLENKKKLVYEILEGTKALLVIDNLETIKAKNLEGIWDFINNVPAPVKVVLTSREYHYHPNQVLSINALRSEDCGYLFDETLRNLRVDLNKYTNIKNKAIELSSGVPIALISIIGQIIMGKNIRSIERDLAENKNTITEFCFKEQIKQLDEECMKVVLTICYADCELDYEAIRYILGNDLQTNLDEILNKTIALSIVKHENRKEEVIYTILPIIKKYINTIENLEEYKEHVYKRLKDYYELKNIEDCEIDLNEKQFSQTSLYPKKMAKRAMMYAESGEYAEAESQFLRCINDYSDESYVWYMYSQYQYRYGNDSYDAINSLKKADSLNQNYLYSRKMGDIHFRLKNYDASIKNYNKAMSKATIQENKTEMLYLIAQVYFDKAKTLRKEAYNLPYNERSAVRDKRDKCYKEVIKNLKSYVEK